MCLAYADVGCELFEGGFAVDWDHFGEADAGSVCLGCYQVGCLSGCCVSHVDDPPSCFYDESNS